MKSLYYRVWADTLTVFQKSKQYSNWRLNSMVFITLLNALNLLTIVMWLGYFGLKTYFIHIDIFPGTIFDAFCSFFIQFALPFLILNYFLVFSGKKYEKILGKYVKDSRSGRPGGLFLQYLFGTVAVFVIPVIIYVIFR